MGAFEHHLWSLPNVVRQDGLQIVFNYSPSSFSHFSIIEYLFLFHQDLKTFIELEGVWVGQSLFEVSCPFFHACFNDGICFGWTPCLPRSSVLPHLLAMLFLACSCMLNAILCLNLHAFASRSKDEHLLKILDFELVHHAWSNSISHACMFGFCAFL